jgi:hypothetical protein
MTIGAWLIPPLAGLCGWLMWSRLAPGPDERDEPLERAFAVVLSAVILTGLTALLLSELGYLRPWVLCGSLLAISVVTVTRRNQLPAAAAPSVRDLAAVLLLTAFVAVTVAPGSEDLLGGRDPGVYSNTAAWLARHGDIRMRSESLALMPAQARPAFHTRILFMGFHVTNAADGRLTPQFLHLVPVFMAIGYWFGGATGLFQVPPLLGLLSALAVFFFARVLLGLWPAVIAAVILALNLAQIWAMRNPYSEGATQLGVFIALWCIARAWDTGGMRWGVLGGIWLGGCFLMRVDTPLLLAGIAPALIVLQASARQPQRWATHAFLPLTMLLAVWGAAHGCMFSRPYIEDLASFLLPLWGLTAAIVAASLAALLRPHYLHPVAEWVHRNGRRLWVVTALVVSAAFVAGMWVRPHLQPFQIDLETGGRTYNEETLARVAWYVSVVGMVLGLGGVLLLLQRWLVDRRTQWVPFLAILLPFSVLYFWRQSIYPDHPWAMRRFLPVIVPGICIGIAAAVCWLWRMGPLRPLGRLAAIIGLGAVVTHEAVMTLPFWSFREKGGVNAQVAAFAERIPERSILLYGHPGPEVLVATPLALFFGRDVLPVMRAVSDPFGEQRDAAFERQVMQWLQQGRGVLYLASSDGDSVFVTPRVRWIPVASLNLRVPTIGASVEHPPRRPQSYDVHLELLRAAQAAGPVSACVRTLSRMGEPLLGVGQGLYGPERHGGYRWAGPDSRIVFPSCDQTGASRFRAVRVLASCGRRAPPEECRVSVALNGAPLGRVELTAVFREHTLAVPPEPAIDAAGPVEVRFHGSRWVPAEAGVNADARELSFQLGGLTLVNASTDDH